MSRIVTVTSGKGGVGKTNISVNMALQMATLGFRTCLFDADLGLANVNILLNVFPAYTLKHVISRERTLDEIIIKQHDGIDIIPGSSGVEMMANLSREQIDHLIKSFSQLNYYDFFIFDTSSGISKDVISFCRASSELIVIITPEPTSLTDSYALIKVLHLNGFNGSVKIVVNQCKSINTAKITYNHFRTVVEKHLSVKISAAGLILTDSKIEDAVKQQQPLISTFPDAKASICIKAMTKNLIEKQADQAKDSDISSFWAKYFDLIHEPLNNEETKTNKNLQKNTAPSNDSDTLHVEYLEKISPSQKAKNIKLSNYSENKTVKIKRIIEKSNLLQLPVMPDVLIKIMELCNNDSASSNELSRLINIDPCLTVKVLKMVNNSSFYKRKKIQKIDEAVIQMGIDIIKNIAITSSAYQTFSQNSDNISYLIKNFWRHSLMCAFIAKGVSEIISYKSPDEAFLSGLLHDIGKLFIFKKFSDHIPLILKTDQNASEWLSNYEIEIEATHSEIGAFLIREWKLNSFMADSVLYHHEDLKRISNSFPIVKIVYTANMICNSYPDEIEKVSDCTKNLLGLNSSQVKNIFNAAENEVDNFKNLFEIPLKQSAGRTASNYLEVNNNKSDKLFDKVKNFSLLNGILQNFLIARDKDSTLKIVKYGLQILFDVNRILFFLHKPSKNHFVLYLPEENTEPELTINFTNSLQKDKNLFEVALHENTITDSFSQKISSKLTIIDEQIIHLLNTEGMICIPMIASKKYLGIIIIGINKNQLDILSNQLELLKMFANHTATQLYRTE